MFRRLIPQEYEFYTLFDQAANHAVTVGKLLQKLTENYGDADPIAREIKAIEHACDEVAHQAIDRLNKSFITPMDREDIHELILRIDDVVDLTTVAAQRMAFFNVTKPTIHAVNLAKQIVRGSEIMARAVHGLRYAKNYDAVQRDCILLHEVENAADDIFQEAIIELYTREKDPIHVIKWKDLYEIMELVTDRHEDVANVLSTVIVKMS